MALPSVGGETIWSRERRHGTRVGGSGQREDNRIIRFPPGKEEQGPFEMTYSFHIFFTSLT